MWMVETGEKARLTDKSRPYCCICGKRSWQLLDCDRAPKGAVLGQDNHSPGTTPKLLTDLITRESLCYLVALQGHQAEISLTCSAPAPSTSSSSSSSSPFSPGTGGVGVR